MARIFSLSFITLLVFQQKSCTGEPLTLVLIGLASGIMGIIDFIWDKVDKYGIGKDEHQAIVQQFNNYNTTNHIKQISEDPSIVDVINQSINESNDKQTLRQLLSELSYEASVIEDWYKEMLTYTKSKSKKEVRGLISQVTARIWNQENGSRFHLNKIYALFLNHDILKLLGSLKKGFKNTCSSNNSLQSVQQIYLKLYSLVTLAGAKTYKTILMAVEFIQKYEPGSSYQEVVKNAKKDILGKQNKIGRKFKHSLKVSSREVWRCDPKHHIEDQTFIELKNMFKKHLFSGGWNNDYCYCDSYRTPINSKFCEYNYRTDYCWKMPICKGDLWDCDNTFKLDTSEVLDTCYTTSGIDSKILYAKKRNKSNSDAIIDDYGHQTTCTGLNQTQFHVSVEKCELCTCTCEEYNSVRAISLEPAFSNINKNRVVTGARLVTKNNVITIEIQEGTLGPMATIVNGSVSWVSNDVQFPTNSYMIRWNGSRQFTLTDIEAYEGSVVVGLQFGTRPKNPEDGITIILHTRRFDFETGKLFQVETAKQFYASEDLYIEDLDTPILAPGKSVALTETNKRIRLTTTGMKQDFGQTVVPFFDIQEVTTTIPSPMSGVGLYYKRYEGYGGYLGLKLFTYDFLKHFNSKISKEVDLNKE